MPHDKLTCVDTSAWIEYLRNSRHPVVAVTRELIGSARVCLLDAVIGELFQGARSAREQGILETFVDVVPVLSGTPQTWQAAGALSARARAAGKTLHLLDCYIATLAAQQHATLLTCDHHFAVIQPLLPHLQLYLM